MIRYTEYCLIKENKDENKRGHNDILKKMGVMDKKGHMNLDNMSQKINTFLKSDDNKEKFLKDIEDEI